MEQLTVKQIKEQLDCADAEQFRVLERSLIADQRKGVVCALEAARRRIESQAAEAQRIASLYAYQKELAESVGSSFAMGLDEVGRGPIAGPLTVGAVVLDDSHMIEGLDDSKRLSSEVREELSKQIKSEALAWSVQFVSAKEIDTRGITAALKKAFVEAIAAIDDQLSGVGAVLLDGNPLRLDRREINVVKGDSKCASIAAASIIAKVERDELMCRLDKDFPQYGFAQNKGYGTEAHRDAIKQYGLSPLHRVSFCSEFTQSTLF